MIGFIWSIISFFYFCIVLTTNISLIILNLVDNIELGSTKSYKFINYLITLIYGSLTLLFVAIVRIWTIPGAKLDISSYCIQWILITVGELYRQKYLKSLIK